MYPEKQFSFVLKVVTWDTFCFVVIPVHKLQIDMRRNPFDGGGIHRFLGRTDRKWAGRQKFPVLLGPRNVNFGARPTPIYRHTWTCIQYVSRTVTPHTNNEITWKCDPACNKSRTLEDCPVLYDRNKAECCAPIREALFWLVLFFENLLVLVVMK